MKIVLLAGGLGTRLAEHTEVKPKPMVEIGGRPMLWHLMKYYGHFGFREFVVTLGHRGEYIKRWFVELTALAGSKTVDLRTGTVTPHAAEDAIDDWLVHLMDTGPATMTGGRVKRCESLLRGGRFMLTYGDGLSNVDLRKLLAFHESHGKIATVTAVRPPARFGGLVFDGDRVAEFTEKPQIGEGWINGGFMVFEPEVFEFLKDDQTVLESDTLESLASAGQLMAFRHERFWQCMDTLRELKLLESHWDNGSAPWRVW